MTDLTALKELLGKVEKAEGPDRELDLKIWRALDAANAPIPGAYTSSIDACVALIERVLPEANCYGFDLTPTCVDAYVSRNNVKSGHWLKSRSHSTAPLAFLAALLSALIAKKESNA